jgi:hypothetical protein
MLGVGEGYTQYPHVRIARSSGRSSGVATAWVRGHPQHAASPSPAARASGACAYGDILRVREATGGRLHPHSTHGLHCTAYYSPCLKKWTTVQQPAAAGSRSGIVSLQLGAESASIQSSWRRRCMRGSAKWLLLLRRS